LYAVRAASRAVKELDGLPPSPRAAILEAIEALAKVPRPPGCRKLSGLLEGSFRLRVGSYRVLYEVFDRDRVVLITKVGPRKSVYR